MENDHAADDYDGTADPDEALASCIADAVLELARVPGPHRLAAMQMAGLADETPSHGDIARAFHLPLRQVRLLERRALAFIQWNHPELRCELHAMRSFQLDRASGQKDFSGEIPREN